LTIVKVGSCFESLVISGVFLVGEENDGVLLLAEDWLNAVLAEVNQTWGAL
jgi:hypothetical protein